jgi:hypothetical protein
LGVFGLFLPKKRENKGIFVFSDNFGDFGDFSVLTTPDQQREQI